MTFEILNFRVNPGPGTLKATADVCFENKVTVCGARLVQNKRTGRLFLSLPTRKVGTAYEPQVLIIDKHLHNAVEKRMIDYFQGNGQAVIVYRFNC